MDLYQLLGVRRSASVAEIRRAFQKAARQLHPDLNPGDPVAANRFRAVSEAFEVLVDIQRRAAYDRGETRTPESAVPEIGFEGFDFSAEVRVGSAAFQDIFAGVLEAKRDAAREGAHRGGTWFFHRRLAYGKRRPRRSGGACDTSASGAEIRIGTRLRFIGWSRRGASRQDHQHR